MYHCGGGCALVVFLVVAVVVVQGWFRIVLKDGPLDNGYRPTDGG
jgi:hypothetical protein